MVSNSSNTIGQYSRFWSKFHKFANFKWPHKVYSCKLLFKPKSYDFRCIHIWWEWKSSTSIRSYGTTIHNPYKYIFVKSNWIYLPDKVSFEKSLKRTFNLFICFDHLKLEMVNFEKSWTFSICWNQYLYQLSRYIVILLLYTILHLDVLHMQMLWDDFYIGHCICLRTWKALYFLKC